MNWNAGQRSGTRRSLSNGAGAYRSWKFWALLGFLFSFRLAYGLTSDFWSPDELQIYLLGLKFYSTHQWPYFGPDVFPGMQPIVQIPGALQGLLVGTPFFLLPLPEAPYLLLNVLSFCGLALLAWYCTKRLPSLSPWVIWTWTMTAPWVLEFSTRVVNPSYVLFGSTLFFVGMMEACRPLRRGALSLRVATFLMGFSLTWIMQLHLSWVVLLPFVLIALVFPPTDEPSALVASYCSFVLGAAAPAILILPTLSRYGFRDGIGGTESALEFNPGNLWSFFTILSRYLSFASFQLYRFFSEGDAGWINLLRGSLWMGPVVLIPCLAGLLQPVLMVVCWFRKTHHEDDWKAIKYLTLFSFLIIYVSFLFTTKRPKAHTFYVCFPVIFVYSLYCWSMFTARRSWNTIVSIALAAGILVQADHTFHGALERSLYKRRALASSAIEKRNYHLLGERRSGARY